MASQQEFVQYIAEQLRDAAYINYRKIGNDKRFVDLYHELDEYLNRVVGGEKQKEQYTQYNGLENIHDVALIIENGEAVACGSFKEYEPDTAEIKRVFTKESCRNHGCSKSIMGALERRAAL